ncbi:MAG TPA: glycosyltransferase, partial [Phenylobacterium sp.]
MRILYLLHQFMPEFSGGTERVTLNLARAAQAEGHHVEVFTTSQHPGADWRPGPDGLRYAVVEGTPVYALPAQPPQPLEELGFRRRDAERAAFRTFLDGRGAFDLAHVTHAMRLVDIVEELQARRIRYLMTLTDFFPICHRVNLIRLNGDLCEGPRGGRNCQVHCWTPEIGESGYGARIERLGAVLRNASVLVAVSDYVAELYRAEHPDLDIRVVGNGVDLLRFPRPRARGGEGPLTFGYLGTVSEAKGATMLVEAFAKAAPADARLRVIGPC